MNGLEFRKQFEFLTGNSPFPWQERLYREHFLEGGIPQACSLPTGLGKTCIVAVWLIALADGAPVPRRLIYVVNRRTVVDQTTVEVERYKSAIDSDPKLSALKAQFESLRISTLRGLFADNGDWCEDPSRSAVICGTVDMIGSRLLFSGYGIGRAKRPLHAGFLGQDALLIHDEAHLEPAFQELIETIQKQQRDHEPAVLWPKLQVMELTATSKSKDPFRLDGKDYANSIVDRRLNATKQLHLHELADSKKPAKELIERALSFKASGKAILIFAQSVETVLETQGAIEKAKLPVQTLTGTMRGKERDDLVLDKSFARFLPTPPDDATVGTVYLICTSAGEVGVNISADHLICDLTTFESMAQRTHVAWRDDVELLSDDKIAERNRSDLLLAYPLLPHELLREPSYRAIKHLEVLGKRHRDHHAWLVTDDGEVEVVTLDYFTDKDNKERINGLTVVLHPRSGGLNSSGMFDGTSETADDVSPTDVRCRSRDIESAPQGFHEVFSIAIPADDEDQGPETCYWFVCRNTGEVRWKKPVLLDVHVSDAERRIDDIIKGLSLGSSIEKCLKTAAKFHDHGKTRPVFQAMLGNRNASKVLWAKSGNQKGIRLEEKYRHELGSLHELPTAAELGLTDDERELVLHLIAAHHGRARPHFPADEVFDPSATPESDRALGQHGATTIRTTAAQVRPLGSGVSGITAASRRLVRQANPTPAERFRRYQTAAPLKRCRVVRIPDREPEFPPLPSGGPIEAGNPDG